MVELSFPRSFRYDTNIIEGTGIRETSPTLSIHDIKLLLLHFADIQSFSENTCNGGRESNIRLILYEMDAILYVLTTRQIEREEKLLQNFLSHLSAFFVHMLKPRFHMTSTTPYGQQLAQFLRCDDAFIMEACTKILKHLKHYFMH